MRQFSELGYDWQLCEGLPPAGSSECQTPTFEQAVRDAVPFLAKSSAHELASWVVARLAYLTSGSLELEGKEFSHDSDEVGYRLKATRRSDAASAQGAIMLAPSRVYFACVEAGLSNFPFIVLELLSQFPRDYEKCVIRIREPESKNSRRYGWDGYSLIR